MKPTMHILSKEMIKPSLETPHRHRKMKLSYLDEMINPVYMPLIFFYKADESTGLTSSNRSQICHHLKRSLSNTLTSFYPLAGTLEHGSLIDCNDTGVEFIEALDDAPLADAIQEDNEDDLHRFLPLDPMSHGKSSPFVAKITFFNCGGISIGICFMHKFSDCASIAMFLNAWAATYRGKLEVPQIDFNLAKIFPARDLPDLSLSVSPDENLRTKRFTFNEETLMVLKREAASPLVTNPTRVEVISAFIWLHFMEMAKSKTSEAACISPVVQVVNLRTRTNPPLSLQNVFGNCYMLPSTFHDTKKPTVAVSTQRLYQELVRKLRSSIKKINEDYIMKAQHGDNYLDDLNEISCMGMKGELMEGCNFSSWCRFPFYEVDYGWGTPIWVCTAAVPSRNLTVLMDTRSGNGIEAWATMEEDKLEMLDREVKLISTFGKHKD